ncbi:hypothetical protein GF339_08585 [candidate division KSB3 bacterium]|uniref:UspA domain-containing protein n=1 Tax=candidate division KSB3 bacterium TaxID=2044937 RepID=A0A9D5JVU0_9BACT|nr:hypothetical protein [candidate division KSB3 bacterium]MBD3324626.1 hypothetical protein [candidate division KSB3 bacterium]
MLFFKNQPSRDELSGVAYKKILIPVDFSSHSEVAAKHGIALAERYRAGVYFLHIGDNGQRSAYALSRFVKGLHAPHPAAIKKLVAQGSPAAAILAVAKKLQTDMIVMGSRGATGLKHLVQGSVAEKVLRESACPVLIIKKRKQTAFDGYVLPQIRHMEEPFHLDKILVPLDFSAASKFALKHAVVLASAYNATIYTLTVFDKKFKEYTGDHERHTSVVIRGEKIRLWKEFPELLQTLNCGFPHNRVKRILLSGDPATKIESVAQKKEIDLVVMGTTGRSGLEHLLLGSVAEKILRSVDCSVMTIRANHV